MNLLVPPPAAPSTSIHNGLTGLLVQCFFAWLFVRIFPKQRPETDDNSRKVYALVRNTSALVVSAVIAVVSAVQFGASIAICVKVRWSTPLGEEYPC
ncbi:hypothetical protein MD484_g5033, partial [Candolleomyces efflorescens]